MPPAQPHLLPPPPLLTPPVSALAAMARGPCPRASRGFPLIEVLCVLVITALLSVMAYPSYQAIVHKSRRTDALVALMRVQAAQENYRSEHLTYAEPAQLGLSAEIAGAHYEVRVDEVSAQGYAVTATARGAQHADADCRVLRLVVSGLDTRQHSGPDARVTNPAGDNRRCWNL